jgi:hypothetical protein
MFIALFCQILEINSKIIIIEVSGDVQQKIKKKPESKKIVQQYF